MSDILEHHGILGQKWGVRRTPAQLGHPTSGNGSGGNIQGSTAASKNDSKKTPGKSSKKPRVMTDEELRQRINRLNMEEQYNNLVARQKTRNTGTAKKLLGEALENLGRKALGVAVDKVIEKISNKGDKFDINDWKDEDVNKMDADTIQKVAKWYQNARSISTNRASASSGANGSSSSASSGTSSSSGSTSSQSSGSSRSGSSSSSSGASRARQNSWVRERRAAMRRLGVR